MTMTDAPPPPPPEMAPPAPRSTDERPKKAAPAPAYVDKGTALNRLPKLPFEVFMLLIVGLILLTVFTVLGQISLSDAETRADDAEAELAAARAEVATVPAVDAVPTIDAGEITALEADVERLTNELAAALAVIDQGVSSDNTADGEVADLTAQVDELGEQLAASEAARATAADELAVARATIDEVSASPEAAAVSSDAFSQYVGELVASADGLRITADESRCLGRAVVAEIGVEALAAGLSTARTSATNDVVIDAVVIGVAECGLDARRVFGQ